MRNSLAATLFVLILTMGLILGWVGGSLRVTTVGSTPTQATTVTPPVVPATAKVVSLYVIPDWGGPGYDAFAFPSDANGTAPPRGTNPSGPGPSNNNVTIPLGVPVTFVITNLDTAVLKNFTGKASVEFTIYENTDSGQVVSRYSQGEAISPLQISHTFSVPSLKIDIPIPPDTIVAFTYTFTSPGVYEYMCYTPCGPGMGVTGYMIGYVIVG